jgi:hypothetical protein
MVEGESMTTDKKPSLGIYIDANGKVYSEPRQVKAMLKWVVKESEIPDQKNVKNEQSLKPKADK